MASRHRDHPLDNHLSADVDWMMQRLLTNLIFDTFVKDMVRARYSVMPDHVTLHAARDEVMLYVSADGRSFMLDDFDLQDWAFEFVAGEMFDLDPERVDVVYLDGAVGSNEPYLYIAGEGILITSGEPASKGNYL